MKNRAVFLDRDGTINIDYGYVHTYEKFEYLDGVIDALKMIKQKGFLLVIVTNQSGIARGYFTEQDFLELHKKVEQDMKLQGVKIDGLYYCPHLTGCTCRKPQLDLFYKAAQELHIDLKRSYAVGDRLRDLSICEKEDVNGFLISDTEEQVGERIQIVRSLKEAAELMV